MLKGVVRHGSYSSPAGAFQGLTFRVPVECWLDLGMCPGVAGDLS